MCLTCSSAHCWIRSWYVTFEPPRMAGGGRVVRGTDAAPSAVEAFLRERDT